MCKVLFIWGINSYFWLLRISLLYHSCAWIARNRIRLACGASSTWEWNGLSRAGPITIKACIWEAEKSLNESWLNYLKRRQSCFWAWRREYFGLPWQTSVFGKRNEDEVSQREISVSELVSYCTSKSWHGQ